MVRAQVPLPPWSIDVGTYISMIPLQFQVGRLGMHPRGVHATGDREMYFLFCSSSENEGATLLNLIYPLSMPKFGRTSVYLANALSVSRHTTLNEQKKSPGLGTGQLVEAIDASMY